MKPNDDDLMWERLMQHRVSPETTEQPTDTELVTEDKAASGDKPDYIDVDDDGDKHESMKDAIKDKEENKDSELEQSDDADKSHNESVDYYIEQTLKDCQALGRERWFRNNWRRDRALLESMATGDHAPTEPFESWSQEDFWRALVGVEQQFYGL